MKNVSDHIIVFLNDVRIFSDFFLKFKNHLKNNQALMIQLD